MTTDLQQRLLGLQDKDYAAFQAKLTPGIPTERFIGVRVPALRRFAKDYAKQPESERFLSCMPHAYFDEDMLHALLLAEVKDFDRCLALVELFLPYVDNWAVCDILSPKALAKNKPMLLDRIREWSASPLTYTCRFGIGMLMAHFLDGDFAPELLDIPAAVRSEEYYVRMMVAWFFATALAKQWDATLPYLVGNRLDTWTHNKTIQKARESFRIAPDQKEYLKTLKRKDSK